MIRNFILNFINFVFKTVAVTKLLPSGILFPTSLIFAFKTVVVTKPLALVFGIFYQHLQFFSLNFVYLPCIDLCELLQLHQEFSFLSYLLLFSVC